MVASCLGKRIKRRSGGLRKSRSGAQEHRGAQEEHYRLRWRGFDEVVDQHEQRRDQEPDHREEQEIS
jgi:hypothetical protein